MEQIEMNDESGDRKYFTIIPNYILNHSTATAQALYLQLKRLAGENGKAYPSSRYLKKQLGISHPTLRKELKYLLEKNWIQYIGETEINTDGGKQKIKSYKIVDLWEENNNFYKRGCKNRDTTSQRGEKIEPQGVKTRGEKIGHKEEPSEEDPSLKKKGSKNKNFFSPVCEPTYEEVEEKYKTKKQILEQKGIAYIKRKQTPKQKKTITALYMLSYFRQEISREFPNLSILKIENKARDKKLRQLVISALDALKQDKLKLKNLIDWWISEGGGWCDFRPENCFSTTTIEQFLNKCPLIELDK